MKALVWVALLGLPILFLARCGKSSSTDLSVAAPAVYITSGMGSATRIGREGDGEVPAEKPPKDAFQDAKDFFKKTADQLKAEAGDLDKKKEYRAVCFGPSWEDNANGGGNGGTNVFQDRPSGDTGMVYPTVDNVSGMACAAGQMAALVGSRSKDVQKIKALVALLLAKGGEAGLALPTTVGDEITVTGVPTPPGTTFTKMAIKLNAKDSSGNAVYKISVEGTGPDGKTINIVALHKPTNADNTEFEGQINAIFPHTASMGGTGTQRAMAVTYKQTSTDYSFVLEGMANRNTADTNFFTSGRINFGSLTTDREDLFKMVATFNRSTQAGTVHYAWMAGGNDLASRTFHATVAGRNNGDSGVGYFGYAATIPTLSDNPGDATIWANQMRCNWKYSMGTSIAKIQKQTMQFNGTVFAPVVNNISFAPTNTCTIGGNWTVRNGPTFLNATNHAEGNPAHALTDYTAASVPQVSPPTVTLSR